MGDITQKWVEIFFPFTSDYKTAMTTSMISKKTQVPQQTANRILNDLVKKNFIKYKTQGKNKLFYFDLKKEQTNLFFNIIECKKSLNFLKKYPKISIIIEDLIEFCDSLIIFGSYPLGKNKEDSDLDIIVLNIKNKEKFNKKSRAFPIEINPHFIKYNEFANLLKKENPLSLEIKHNHILIGNISKLVRIFKNG